MAGLRENIGRQILRRKLKGFSRETVVHNFETAKSAVIVFDTSAPNSFSAIKEFREFAEKNKVTCSVYGYVPQKEVPQEMLFWKNFFFVTKRNLNWYLKPSGETVDSFFSQDPDILIDFSQGLPLELQFLVQLSPARFKIGCYTEQQNDYDLMINLTQQDDMAYLSEQIRHYVSMLNPVN
ncbi:MAG: hypothetical protein E4H10_09545 [Bacteroidia bacterium]|nr:MAG: hypothetical protein E4H10_09545 [Bacteroidia bacterium]